MMQLILNTAIVSRDCRHIGTQQYLLWLLNIKIEREVSLLLLNPPLLLTHGKLPRSLRLRRRHCNNLITLVVMPPVVVVNG